MHDASFAFLKNLLETPSPSGFERPILHGLPQSHLSHLRPGSADFVSGGDHHIGKFDHRVPRAHSALIMYSHDEPAASGSDLGLFGKPENAQRVTAHGQWQHAERHG